MIFLLPGRSNGMEEIKKKQEDGNEKRGKRKGGRFDSCRVKNKF